jgi:hypothetical protein
MHQHNPLRLALPQPFLSVLSAFVTYHSVFSMCRFFELAWDTPCFSDFVAFRQQAGAGLNIYGVPTNLFPSLLSRNRPRLSLKKRRSMPPKPSPIILVRPPETNSTVAPNVSPTSAEMQNRDAANANPDSHITGVEHDAYPTPPQSGKSVHWALPLDDLVLADIIPSDIVYFRIWLF